MIMSRLTGRDTTSEPRRASQRVLGRRLRVFQSSASASQPEERDQAGEEGHLGVRARPVDPPADQALGQRGRGPGEEAEHAGDLAHLPNRELLGEGIVRGKLAERAEADRQQADQQEPRGRQHRRRRHSTAVSKAQTVNAAIRARCTVQPAPASHLTSNPTRMQPIPATR